MNKAKILVADDIKQNVKLLRVILTASEFDDRIKGIEAGADDFISKPFNKTELLARVKALLRMRQIPAKEEETNVLESILSELEEGVVVTDGQWKITHINQTAKELLNINETDTANIDIQTH